MFENLKKEVYEANKMLPELGLVLFTWGNASGVDREKKVIAIKPSGVTYESMKPEDMVIVDFDGNVIEGDLRPSSDTDTHIELYKAFSEIGAIVHTHSVWATVWAQAGMDIPALGTTHADYFFGDIPCTRQLTDEEINGEYEKNTGFVIAETFKGKNPFHIPAVLVKNHGPFTWGKNPKDAVHNAAVLENVAMMAKNAKDLNDNIQKAPDVLLSKHFMRKHGPGAYYGQK